MPSSRPPCSRTSATSRPTPAVSSWSGTPPTSTSTALPSVRSSPTPPRMPRRRSSAPATALPRTPWSRHCCRWRSTTWPPLMRGSPPSPRCRASSAEPVGGAGTPPAPPPSAVVPRRDIHDIHGSRAHRGRHPTAGTIPPAYRRQGASHAALTHLPVGGGLRPVRVRRPVLPAVRRLRAVPAHLHRVGELPRLPAQLRDDVGGAGELCLAVHQRPVLQRTAQDLHDRCAVHRPAAAHGAGPGAPAQLQHAGPELLPGLDDHALRHLGGRGDPGVRPDLRARRRLRELAAVHRRCRGGGLA